MQSKCTISMSHSTPSPNPFYPRVQLEAAACKFAPLELTVCMSRIICKKEVATFYQYPNLILVNHSHFVPGWILWCAISVSVRLLASTVSTAAITASVTASVCCVFCCILFPFHSRISFVLQLMCSLCCFTKSRKSCSQKTQFKRSGITQKLVSPQSVLLSSFCRLPCLFQPQMATTGTPSCKAVAMPERAAINLPTATRSPPQPTHAAALHGSLAPALMMTPASANAACFQFPISVATYA